MLEIKVSGAHFLNGGKLAAIGEVCRYRHDITHFATSFSENQLDVLKALLRLSDDVSFADNVLVRIPGNLAGELHSHTGVLHKSHTEATSARLPNSRWIQCITHLTILSIWLQLTALQTRIANNNGCAEMRSNNSVFKPLMVLACCIQFATALSAAAMGPTARNSADPKRIALLIGNENYAATVGPLANPGNDVNLIASALEEIGFDRRNIRTVNNANRVATLQAIDEYANKVAAAGPDAVAFFYYSGHGAASQQDRRNYIIPTEVKALDRTVWYQAIALDDVVTQLATRAPSASHFVIFDACRNLLKMPTKGKKGFVPMAEKSGMLIAFSTDPGETASDEGAGAGPYASALAAELVKPGQDHLDLFQNVKERVHQTTSGQRPWERNGLLKRVYLNGSAPENNNSANANAAAAWEAVKNSKDPGILKAFAQRFGGTFFADLASRRMKQLNSGSSSTTGPLTNVALTAPKWQRAKGFQRVSRSETQQLLAGNTIASQSNKKWLRYFASDGTYSGMNHQGSKTSGTWRIGQNGIIYLKGSTTEPNYCPAAIKYNGETRSFQWSWQKNCNTDTPVIIAAGNRLTQ